MAGARQRQPTALQNTRGGRGRRVAVLGRSPQWRMPPLPKTVTAVLSDPVQARLQPEAVRHAREIWRRWWHSSPSSAVDLESDLEALTWWIVCVFRRALYLQIVREQPLVKGSMGQPVANPLEGVIRGLTADIDRAADRFGMDLRSRFRFAFETPANDRHDEEDRDAEDEYRRLIAG